MKITRLNNDKNLSIQANRIVIQHGNEQYTITPEIIGFRVHKHSIDDELLIKPACANELIIK